MTQDLTAEHTYDEEADLRKFITTLNEANLGPIVSSSFVTVGGLEVLHVELDGRSGHVGRTLARWCTLVEVLDSTVGKFRDSDENVRFHLRGLFPSGVPVVILVEFGEATPAGQVVLQHSDHMTAVHKLVRLDDSTTNVTTTADGRSDSR